VELKRAVAHGMAVGPAAGLELTDALMQQAARADRHLLAAVRGDLLLSVRLALLWAFARLPEGFIARNGTTAMEQTLVLPKATLIGALSAHCDVHHRNPGCLVNVDSRH
jgi:hypothetical protein